MKKFWGLILFIFLMCINQCYAARFNFLVIPTDLFVTDKEYLVFPKSANFISNDVINYYNQHPDMSAVQIYQIKNYFEKPENFRYKKDFQKFLKDYRDNYSIDFNMVQRLASTFRVKQVLLVHCNMDAQNYITRRTVWDALNIPGATVIDPAYRLTTQVTLIDPNNQSVLWRNNYQKLISSRENRIIATSYNDASEQLEKVNKYSTKFLAPQIVQETQLALSKISPYQNLNLLHPEVVKPDYVSIDKAKIDTKRTAVRSRRALARWGRSRKSGVKNYFKNKKEYKALPTDKKMDIIQDKFDKKLYKQEQKQQIKFEKAKQKQELKAAKEKIKLENKLKLQQERIELKQQLKQNNAALKEKYLTPKADVQPVSTIDNIDIVPEDNAALLDKESKVNKKSKGLFGKSKSSKKDKDKAELEIKTETETQVLPSQIIIQKDLKPVPYIRTKTNYEEKDYTINDF